MADILIRNMEMPEGDDDVKIIINSDGSVHRIIGWAISEKIKAKATKIPSHGRLIDADELIAKIKRPLTNNSRFVWESYAQPIIDSIESAPTVLGEGASK